MLRGVAAKSSNPRSRCQCIHIWFRRRSMVRFRVPPPIPKARTRFGLFHVCPPRQCWRAFADLPRERHPPHFRAFGPPWPLCSRFLSGGLASVREATSSIGAGFRAVGCGCRLVASGDRSMKSRQIIFRGNWPWLFPALGSGHSSGCSTLKPAG